MPTHRQLLTEPSAKGGKATLGLGTFAPGSADYAALKQQYPASPAYDGTYDDAHVVQVYEEVNTSPLNDGGHTFGEVSRDYEGAPNLEEVVTGGGGLPGTPYSPNTTSPGPGDLNAANQPAKDIHNKGGGGFGSGDGLTSPKTTSTNIARQKIGNLIFGKSNPR